MLKTICTRKRNLILPILSLLYLVIGAHALHPNFHEHDDIRPESSHQHVVSEASHHTIDTDISTGHDHHSCPICKFLAVNSALEFGALRFFTPLFPDQQVDTDRRLAVRSVHQTGFHIRGPPAMLPS